MSSEVRPAPRRGKSLRILLAALALLLTVLLGLAGWLLGSESGARALLPWLIAQSGANVRIDGLQGRIVAQLGAQRVVVETEGQRIEFSELRLSWNPWSLLSSGTLHIRSLGAGRLLIVQPLDAPEEQPAELPASLALPLNVRVDELHLDGGEIRRGPAPLLTLGPLDLGLEYANARYLLDLKRIGARPELEAGRVTASAAGRLELGAQRPFPLDGRFALESSASQDRHTLSSSGTLTLAGSLAALRAALELKVNDEDVRGHAELRPFSPQMLAGAELHAQGLDLAAIDAALPRTRLDIAFDAQADGAGTLRLRNHAPGTPGAGGLPLQALELAFNQREGGIDFKDLRTRLGSAADEKRAAGTLTGHGSYRNGALHLTLQTEKLNLQGLDPQLRATQLSGTVTARHEEGRQTFTVALREPFGRHGIALQAEGVLADAELDIREALVQSGPGSLVASGRMSFEGKQPFRAQGKLNGFDLHAFGRFEQIPAMNLNGGFTLVGERSPTLQADLDFRITDSRLAGEPLRGDGVVRVRGERLMVPDLNLASGRNRLQAKGELAGDDGKLDFALDAPDLAAFGPAFAGALHAEGMARGTLDAPSVRLSWRADKARLPGEAHIGSMHGKAELQLDRATPLVIVQAEASLQARDLQRADARLAKLDARLHVGARAQDALLLDVEAGGIEAGGSKIDRLRIDADGTNASHTLRARMEENGQQWSLAAAGALLALDSTARWEGQLQTLEGSGRIDLASEGTAPVLLSAERQRIEALRLKVDGGRIALTRFERKAEGIVTSGRIEHLQAAPWLRRSAFGERIESDLQLSGAWDLRLEDALDGTLHLQRDSGDLTILGATPTALGLSTLHANLRAERGILALALQVQGRQLGRIVLGASTRLGADGNPLAPAPGAPLAGSAELDIPSIAWLAPIAEPLLTADGRIQGKVVLDGSLAAPQISGRIAGDALRLAHGELGLDLRNGSLRGEFDENRLDLQALRFEGAEGHVALSGPIVFGEARGADLRLVAERFALLNRPDRALSLSGSAHIAWREAGARVAGEFQVDSGLFDIGTSDAPRLSQDVVIVGQEARGTAGMPLAADILVRLGEGIQVEGRGLNARVGGQLRVTSKAGENLRAEGTLRVLRGSFSAYGRELAIEEGELRFTGPIDNPALDIVAMRRGQEVEAGVAVSGNVLAPRVTLVSEPPVPDAEKLAWLVIGRSLANAAPGDVGSLQDAAATLLTQGAAAGVQAGIASAFGLDTLSVRTAANGDLEERIVTVGKQLSSRLYLGYQRGLESAASVVQMRYLLTPRLSVEAEAGARSALSLFYNLSFD